MARRPEPAATIIAAQDEAVFGLDGIDLFCITVTFIPNVYDFVHWILDVTTQELSNCLHNLWIERMWTLAMIVITKTLNAIIQIMIVEMRG